MKHSISKSNDQVILRIWEPALKIGDRTMPVLYKARYVLRSEGEAIAQLALHKRLNQLNQHEVIRN